MNYPNEWIAFTKQGHEWFKFHPRWNRAMVWSFSSLLHQMTQWIGNLWWFNLFLELHNELGGQIKPKALVMDELFERSGHQQIMNINFWNMVQLFVLQNVELWLHDVSNAFLLHSKLWYKSIGHGKQMSVLNYKAIRDSFF
jgi:hypothetical protein